MNGWGVAVGAVSLFLALIFGVVAHFVSALKPLVKYVAIVWTLWWACGVSTPAPDSCMSVDRLHMLE